MVLENSPGSGRAVSAGLQLLRVPKAQGKQLEMLLGHELGAGRGMAREVLTAGGNGGFAKRTFSVD